MRHGTSTKRKRRRCNTTSASISGYSSGKLRENKPSAVRFTPTNPEVGSRTGLPRIGRSTARKKTIPAARNAPKLRPVAVDESRSDHHLAAFLLQRLEDRGDIARIVLAVAIHADHVVVAQLVRQPIAGLHASAQPQVMRQRQHTRAGPRAP